MLNINAMEVVAQFVGLIEAEPKGINVHRQLAVEWSSALMMAEPKVFIMLFWFNHTFVSVDSPDEERQ